MASRGRWGRSLPVCLSFFTNRTREYCRRAITSCDGLAPLIPFWEIPFQAWWLVQPQKVPKSFLSITSYKLAHNSTFHSVRDTRSIKISKAGHWEDLENRRQFLLTFAEQMNFDPMIKANWKRPGLKHVLSINKVRLNLLMIFACLLLSYSGNESLGSIWNFRSRACGWYISWTIPTRTKRYLLLFSLSIRI